MGRLPLIGAAALIALSASAALAQEAGDAQRGLAYAKVNCAECHGVLASDVDSPRSGVAAFKRIAETPGMTGTAITVWLQTSHPTMPNFMIAPGDRADIVAYILSLRDRRTGASPMR